MTGQLKCVGDEIKQELIASSQKTPGFQCTGKCRFRFGREECGLTYRVRTDIDPGNESGRTHVEIEVGGCLYEALVRKGTIKVN